jgi:hypothetical protein
MKTLLRSCLAVVMLLGLASGILPRRSATKGFVPHVPGIPACKPAPTGGGCTLGLK